MFYGETKWNRYLFFNQINIFCFRLIPSSRNCRGRFESWWQRSKWKTAWPCPRRRSFRTRRPNSRMLRRNFKPLSRRSPAQRSRFVLPSPSDRCSSVQEPLKPLTHRLLLVALLHLPPASRHHQSLARSATLHQWWPSWAVTVPTALTTISFTCGT